MLDKLLRTLKTTKLPHKESKLPVMTNMLFGKERTQNTKLPFKLLMMVLNSSNTYPLEPHSLKLSQSSNKSKRNSLNKPLTSLYSSLSLLLLLNSQLKELTKRL